MVGRAASDVPADSRPLMSVIVVSWNTRDLLRECLDSVGRYVPREKTEVIVVDNNSRDGSQQLVEQEFPWCLLIKNDDNVGFGRANNQAAAVARGRYLVLLNSDTRMTDGGLADIVAYMDQHPDIGIAGGKILTSDLRVDPPYRRFPGLLGSLMDQTVFRALPPMRLYRHWRKYGNRSPDQINDVDWVTGAYQIIRGECIENGKLFDEEIFMYYEDTLLCHRTWKRGYRVVYLPFAPVIHHLGQSGKTVKARTVWNSFQGSAIYIGRRYGTRAARAYSAVVRVTWGVFYILLAIPAAVGGARLRRKRDFFSALRAGNFRE